MAGGVPSFASAMKCRSAFQSVTTSAWALQARPAIKVAIR
jgi:hypothetical protein